MFGRNGRGFSTSPAATIEGVAFASALARRLRSVNGDGGTELPSRARSAACARSSSSVSLILGKVRLARFGLVFLDLFAKRRGVCHEVAHDLDRLDVLIPAIAHRREGSGRIAQPSHALNLGHPRRPCSELSSVLSIDDPNLSEQGKFEKRRATIKRAQSALSAHLPAEQAVPDRAAALDALRPTTADGVAVQAREWQKVEALLAAGRNLRHIIGNADRPRLAAIADGIEVMPDVLNSADGEAIAREVRDVVFARLVALGDEVAVRIADEEAAAAPVIAARAYLTDTLDRGAPGYDGLAAIHRVDPTLYGLLRDGADQHDLSAIERMLSRTRTAIERAWSHSARWTLEGGHRPCGVAALPDAGPIIGREESECEVCET